MSFLVKLLIIIAVILSAIWLMNSNSAGNREANFDVMKKCINHVNLGLHIHPYLEIMINGEKQKIPANIGIESLDCMRPVHTHDQSGTLHIEWGRKRDFPLEDFFKVWGKIFNQTQLLDYQADENHEIIMTVNGQRSEEYEKLVMKDGDRIVIIYGEK
ncbi:MAG: hypothetical protein AAB338_00205 [Patescibacteria group bacterium]